MILKRQKKGGNTFYVPVIDPKSSAELQFTKEDNDTLTVFQQAVKKEKTMKLSQLQKMLEQKNQVIKMVRTLKL